MVSERLQSPVLVFNVCLNHHSRHATKMLVYWKNSFPWKTKSHKGQIELLIKFKFFKTNNCTLTICDWFNSNFVKKIATRLSPGSRLLSDF